MTGTMPNWRDVGPKLLGLLAVSYFALWACGLPVGAQMAAMPSMANVRPGHHGEFGIAGSTTRKAARVAEPGLPADAFAETWEYDTQVWGGGHFRWVDFGYLGALGQNSLQVGAFLRFNAVESELWRLGIQVGGGLVGAHVALPVAMRMTPELWLYTAPTLAFSRIPVRLPVGVGYTVTPWLTVLAEGSYGPTRLSERLDEVTCDGPCHAATFSLGLSFHP